MIAAGAKAFGPNGRGEAYLFGGILLRRIFVVATGTMG